jgi:hypothetical protein
MALVYGVGVRRAVSAIVIAVGLAVFAPPIGEADKTEVWAIDALRVTASLLAHRLAKDPASYDTLACLAAPPCVPSQGDGMPFLDGRWQLPQRSRYRLYFHAGPQAGHVSDRRSRSTMTRFAVVAVPVNLAAAQYRSFCTDDRQEVYFTAAGTVPRVEVGRCLEISNPLP